MTRRVLFASLFAGFGAVVARLSGGPRKPAPITLPYWDGDPGKAIIKRVGTCKKINGGFAVEGWWIDARTMTAAWPRPPIILGHSGSHGYGSWSGGVLYDWKGPEPEAQSAFLVGGYTPEELSDISQRYRA